MLIKFLKNVTAPQNYYHVYCECCGPERRVADEFFPAGTEVDPEEVGGEIDLKGLVYKEDYEITQYP